MERLQVTDSSKANPRKIPAAVFIEKVEETVKLHGGEAVMETLQEAFGKYKMMESTLTRSKENMKVKIPEIQKALEIIDFMDKKQNQDNNVDFLLTDTIWAKGKILKGTNKVNLWLGANIMVEYTFAEAKTLLTKNLENAQSNLKVFEEDLQFLRDQITTCEVNLARTYNATMQLKAGKA